MGALAREVVEKAIVESVYIRQAASRASERVHLADRTIELWRGIAETEVNSALAGAYTVPFNPAPAVVKSPTLELATALLLVDAYGNGAYGARLKDARAKVTAYGDNSSCYGRKRAISLDIKLSRWVPGC